MQLDKGLTSYDELTPIIERWKKIAQMIPTKTLEECIYRYIEINKKMKEMSWKMRDLTPENSPNEKNYLWNFNAFHKPKGTELILNEFSRKGV